MVIDRIEGQLAVVELAKGRYVEVPISIIRGEVRDGAVLVSEGKGYAVDERATAERAELVRQKRRRLFRRP